MIAATTETVEVSSQELVVFSYSSPFANLLQAASRYFSFFDKNIAIKQVKFILYL